MSTSLGGVFISKISQLGINVVTGDQLYLPATNGLYNSTFSKYFQEDDYLRPVGWGFGPSEYPSVALHPGIRLRCGNGYKTGTTDLDHTHMAQQFHNPISTGEVSLLNSVSQIVLINIRLGEVELTTNTMKIYFMESIEGPSHVVEIAPGSSYNTISCYVQLMKDTITQILDLRFEMYATLEEESSAVEFVEIMGIEYHGVVFPYQIKKEQPKPGSVE